MIVATLPALAHERRCDFFGEFFRSGDRVHLGAELALQHVSHQRIVRAAEHDDVDASLA